MPTDEVKSQDWLVVMTKPKMEIVAEQALLKRGFCVYRPKLNRKSLSSESNRKENPERPLSLMFPRYLFIQEEQQSLPPSKIRCISGVSHLVRCNAQWARVNTSLIKQLQQIETSYLAADSQCENEIEPLLTPVFGKLSHKAFKCEKQRVIRLMELLSQQQADLPSKLQSNKISAIA